MDHREAPIKRQHGTPPTAQLMEARGEVACQHAASGVRAGLDAQAHEIFDAASLGYGDVLSTAASLASMTDDDNGTVLWTVNSSSLGPAVAENQSVALQWWIEGASSSFGSTVPYSIVLALHAPGIGLSHPVGASTATHISNNATHVHLTGAASCQRHADAPALYGQRCTTSIRAWSPTTVVPIEVMALSPVSERRVPLDLAVVDAALNARQASSTATNIRWRCGS